MVGIARSASSGGTLRSYTFATLPASGAYTGEIVYVSDVASGGSHWQWSGSLWKPVNGVMTYHKLAAEVTAADNTNEQVLDYTGAFPAGLLAVGDTLRIRVAGTLSGVTYAIKFRFGTAHTTSDTAFAQSNWTANQEISYSLRIVSATSAVLLAGAAISSVITIPNVSSNSNYLSLTVQKSTGSPVITLKYFTVELNK